MPREMKIVEKVGDESQLAALMVTDHGLGLTLRSVLTRPGCEYVAAAMCFDSWMFACGPGRSTCENPTHCEHTQWVDAGKSIADHPHGLESRTVHIVTPDRKMVMIQQIRGERPVVVWDLKGDGDGPGGRVPDALHALAQAIARAPERN